MTQLYPALIFEVFMGKAYKDYTQKQKKCGDKCHDHKTPGYGKLRVLCAKVAIIWQIWSFVGLMWPIPIVEALNIAFSRNSLFSRRWYGIMRPWHDYGGVGGQIIFAKMFSRSILISVTRLGHPRGQVFINRASRSHYRICISQFAARPRFSYKKHHV